MIAPGQRQYPEERKTCRQGPAMLRQSQMHAA